MKPVEQSPKMGEVFHIKATPYKNSLCIKSTHKWDGCEDSFTIVADKSTDPYAAWAESQCGAVVSLGDLVVVMHRFSKRCVLRVYKVTGVDFTNALIYLSVELFQTVRGKWLENKKPDKRFREVIPLLNQRMGRRKFLWLWV